MGVFRDHKDPISPAAVSDHDEFVKPVPTVEKIDYSGAHEKTDPREIALVKKLDRWIMVRLAKYSCVWKYFC